MQFTAEQEHWQQLARDFANEEVRPIALARDRIPDPTDTFDWEVIRKGSKLGFRTLALSRKYGGHEVDVVAQALVMIELARGDSSVSKTFSQCMKWSHLIEVVATDEQCERFLPAFAQDDTSLLGWAGTEPGSGSDGRVPVADPNAGWMTRAVRDGDEWVVNGRKQFIANGSVANLVFVPTRTDRTVGLKEGVTVFLVPIADQPGLSIGRTHDKIGWRFYQNAELLFEDFRVPDANRIGEVNGGLVARGKDRSGFGDIELAANATGVCEAALDMAIDHARSQTRGGTRLIDHQTIRLHLSEMDMLTSSLRALTLQAARESMEGPPVNNTAAMNLAAEVIQRVTDLNMDVHGPTSVRKDLGAEKLLRDATIWRHLAGDSVQRMKGLAKIERKRDARR